MNIIILAAGQGKRMKSKIPKVLYPILGKPLIQFVTDLAVSLSPGKVIVVVSENHAEIKKCISQEDITYVVQDPPLGTGDAVKKALATVTEGHVLILSGDVPLLRKETIESLISFHDDHSSDFTVVTAEIDNPYGYGRIVKNKKGQIERIVEEIDADDKIKKLKLINGGIYFANSSALKQALEVIQPDNRQREYYLTDAVKIIIDSGGRVFSFAVEDAIEIFGINSKSELAKLRGIVKNQYFNKLMSEGVFIEDPATTSIDLNVRLGREVVIHPNTVIEGDCTIGDNCRIGPFVWIKNTDISSNSVIAYQNYSQAP